MLTCFLRSLVYRGILGPTPGRPSLRGPVQLCLRVAYVLLTCCLRSFVYPSVLGPRSRTSVLPGDPYWRAYVPCVFKRNPAWRPSGGRMAGEGGFSTPLIGAR